jgi:hypothetical protein
LADEDWDFSVCEFEENVLALGLPFMLWDWLDVSGFDFDFWVGGEESFDLFEDEVVIDFIHLWGVGGEEVLFGCGGVD